MRRHAYSSVTESMRWLLRMVTLVAGLAPAVCGATLIGVLEQTSPVATTYTEFVDFRTFSDDGFPAAEGDVTALLQAVDIGITSGCEDADFASFTPGSIALMTRGVCFFSDKIINAAEAGAVGALIYNNVAGLTGGLLVDTTTIPALLLTDTLGASLLTALDQGVVTVHMSVTRIPEPTTLALIGIGLAGLGFSRRRRRTVH